MKTFEEAWRYNGPERVMMAQVPTIVPSDEPSDEMHAKSDIGPRWEHEDRITAVLNGEHIPETIEESRELVKERFGCIFKMLPAHHQRDPEIVMNATVRSSGHGLAHINEEATDVLTPAFIIEALQKGAHGWILKYAPQAQKDYDAVLACVSDYGPAVGYASKELQHIRAILDASEEELQAARKRCNAYQATPILEKE